MSNSSRWQPPAKIRSCPFIRLVRTDDTFYLVRRSAIIAIEPAYSSDGQLRDHCFVNVAGEKIDVKHSMEHVLDVIWEDRSHES